MPHLSDQNPVKIDFSISTRDLVLVLGIGLTVCLPLLFGGLPYVGDLPHHYRTALGFYDSMLNGNYYPSWHPGTNGGYGDPSVRFYPPALYFLLSAGRLILGDWFFASLVTSMLLTIAGSVGMYLWARSFTPRYYALAAGLIFLLAPFHTNEMYQAGMYPQYAAGSILPFVFASIERIIRRGLNRHVASLGISYALLILFHVPLAVIGSIGLAIYTVIRLSQSFSLKAACRLIGGVLLAAALSCFYWLPVVTELKWKYPSGVGQGAWFDYRNNFLFINSPSVMSNFLLPLLVAATFAMAIPAVILVLRKDRQALAPAVVGAFAFFMSLPISKLIWDQLPILQETQFPWRWMTISSACLALLVTMSLSELVVRAYSAWRPAVLVLVGSLLIAQTFTVMQLIRGAPLFHRAAFNERVDSQKDTKTNRDFLPIWASDQPRKMEVAVEADNRAVTIIDWSPEHKVFSISAGAPEEVRLRTFYYPYWQGFANGSKLNTRPDDDGVLLVTVPSANARVEVKFVEPWTSHIAAYISLLALTSVFLTLVSAYAPGLFPSWGIRRRESHHARSPIGELKAEYEPDVQL